MKQILTFILFFLSLNTTFIAKADVVYLHNDALGSPIAESDASGNIISRSHYKPFGETLEASKDDVGYTGHLNDVDLGLTYMQARYYDPVIGRFYSNDPVGFTGAVDTFNRYSYVANNPYRYTDPSGESKKIIDEARKAIINAKNRGKRAALKQERQDLIDTGQSKSNLSPEQKAELIKTGKIKNQHGHHDPSVSNGKTLDEKIKIAEDGDNVFLVSGKKHRQIHKDAGGTKKPIDTRGKLLKKAGSVATVILTVLDPFRGVEPPFQSDPCANNDNCA